MTTRKNKKSKKRIIRKKLKYTQKGRGLLEDSKKAISSAAKKQVSKYTRGPLEKRSLEEMRQAMEARRVMNSRITPQVECSLCGQPLLPAPLSVIDTTPQRLKELGVVQACRNGHFFHEQCVLNHARANIGTPWDQRTDRLCPLCRDPSYGLFAERLLSQQSASIQAARIRQQEEERIREQDAARLELPRLQQRIDALRAEYNPIYDEYQKIHVQILQGGVVPRGFQRLEQQRNNMSEQLGEMEHEKQELERIVYPRHQYPERYSPDYDTDDNE